MYPTTTSGATGASGSGVAPSVTSATSMATLTSSVAVSMATASGISDPPACGPVPTEYMKSIPKTTTTMTGVYHWRSTRTIYYGGFLLCSLRRDFGPWQRCGILNSRRLIFFTSCRIGFVTIPG
jgi:hypothetical protein